MALSPEARERLADVVELQPTKNAALQERWGLDSGSEVHQFLESELEEYYYRDEDSRICATPSAVELFGGTPEAVAVSSLQSSVLDVIAGPDEEPQSVVSVLHDLRTAGEDREVDAVRSALRDLADKGVLESVEKTVPTYRLAAPREALDVREREE